MIRARDMVPLASATSIARDDAALRPLRPSASVAAGSLAPFGHSASPAGSPSAGTPGAGGASGGPSASWLGDYFTGDIAGYEQGRVGSMPGIGGSTGQFGSFPAGVRGPGADFSSGKNAVGGFIPDVSGPVDDNGPIVRDEGAYEHRSADKKPFIPGATGPQLNVSALPLDVTRARRAPQLKAGGPDGPNDPGKNPFGTFTPSTAGLTGVYGRGSGRLVPAPAGHPTNPLTSFAGFGGRGWDPGHTGGTQDDATPPAQSQKDKIAAEEKHYAKVGGEIGVGAGFAAGGIAGALVGKAAGPLGIFEGATWGAAIGATGGAIAGSLIGATYGYFHAGGHVFGGGFPSGLEAPSLPRHKAKHSRPRGSFLPQQGGDWGGTGGNPRERDVMPYDDSGYGGGGGGPRAFGAMPTNDDTSSGGGSSGPRARDVMPSDDSTSFAGHNPRSMTAMAGYSRRRARGVTDYRPAPDDAVGGGTPRS